MKRVEPTDEQLRDDFNAMDRRARGVVAEMLTKEMAYYTAGNHTYGPTFLGIVGAHLIGAGFRWLKQIGAPDDVVAGFLGASVAEVVRQGREAGLDMAKLTEIIRDQFKRE